MLDPASLPAAGVRTGRGRRRIAAQQFLVHPPELQARLMKVALGRLECLGRRGRGDPTAADRFDHRERFQRVRGIAEMLMGSVQLLALLLRELLWLTTYLHVAPSEQRVALGPGHPTPYHPTVAQRDPALRSPSPQINSYIQAGKAMLVSCANQ